MARSSRPTPPFSASNNAALGFWRRHQQQYGALNSSLTTVNSGGTLDLSGSTITEPITLSGGSITNSGRTGWLPSLTEFSAANSPRPGRHLETQFHGQLFRRRAPLNAAAGISSWRYTTNSISLGTQSGTYTSKPAVTFSGETPGFPSASLLSRQSATNGGTLNLSGTNLTVTTPGFYSPTALAGVTITITGGGGTQTATIVNNTFVLEGIQQTNAGSGYTSTPVLSFNNGGSATATTIGPAGVTFSGTNSNSIGGSNGDISIAGVISGTSTTATLNKTGSDNLFLSAASHASETESTSMPVPS